MGQCNGGAPSQAVEEFFVPQTGVALRVRNSRKFGWRKDLPDHRDRYLALHSSKKESLPSTCDLRPQMGFDIYDQGNLGSCTANAIAGAFHFSQLKQGCKDFQPARLYIYYNERAIEGTCDQDSGAAIRDGMVACSKLGVCRETTWPYDVDKFAEKPAPACYSEGKDNLVKAYARVPQTLLDLKACLNEGFPFCFGFLVLSSFMTPEVAKTGKMCMPKDDDGVLGGHAVLCVGYDDDLGCFIIRNSWGADWGVKGHFYMPYEYMCWEQLVQDIWCINCVEGEEFPCKTSRELI